MVKQFSLTKLILSLAITLQFSGVLAKIINLSVFHTLKPNEPILERDLERFERDLEICKKKKDCINRFGMLFIKEYLEKETYHKQQQYDREENIKTIRQLVQTNNDQTKFAEHVYRKIPSFTSEMTLTKIVCRPKQKLVEKLENLD